MIPAKVLAVWIAPPIWCVLAATAGRRVAGVTLVVAVLCLGAAILVRLGSAASHKSSALRRARALLGLGLLVVSAASTIGLSPTFGVAAQDRVRLLVTLGCALMGLALTALVHAQTPEHTLSTLFEGILCIAALIFFPWAGAANGGAPIDAIVRVVPLFIGGLLVWLGVRVATNCRRPCRAMWLLMSATAGLLAIDVVETTEFLYGRGLELELLYLLRIGACAVIAVAILDTSIHEAGERVYASPDSRELGRVLAPLGLTLLAPALFSLQALRGDPPPLPVVLGGSSVLALLVALLLVRLVHEGVSAQIRAHHDPLTGLPNRGLFHDRLDVALAEAHRSGTCVGLMFLDLDHFKTINDSLGHAIGNQLLQQVGNRLRSCTRGSDTVGRVGGDEFMVLLPDVSGESDCVEVAEKILRAFVEPFSIEARELATSASIGIAVYPDGGADTDSLIKNADVAMYRAKANSRNSYQVYRPDMRARAQVKRSLERSLRRAVEGGELELHFQPKVDARTCTIVGLEALARWRHADLGFIAPSTFIPLAEETGLILAVGDWVLEETCRNLQGWHDRHGAQIPVAVNLSARELAERTVGTRVMEALTRHRLDPRMLEFEVSERIFVHDLDAASEALLNLRDIGVRCSIDDFGTGYTGLMHLSELPIFGLKIDRSFVGRIGATVAGDHVVDAVITLARSLQMNVVAEGVETGAQARFLRARGCDQMQGILFSPPLTVPILDALLGGSRTAIPDHSRIGGDCESTRLIASEAHGDGQLLAALCRNEEIDTIHADRIAAVLASLESRRGATGSAMTPH